MLLNYRVVWAIGNTKKNLELIDRAGPKRLILSKCFFPLQMKTTFVVNSTRRSCLKGMLTFNKLMKDQLDRSQA